MKLVRRPVGVRTRLALWYGLAVGITLISYAAVVYAFFRASLLEQLADRLHDDYETVEHELERTPDGSLRWIARAEDGDAERTEARWAEISRPGGEALLRRPARVDPAGGPYRTYEAVHGLGGEDFVIRVGRSEIGLRRELRELLLIFGAGLLPSVLLAYLGGRVLARRALAPVERMTNEARAITADRLSDRLPVENAGDELGRQAIAFNELIARLERAFEQLRRFTADASHELRTPLTAIRSVGEVGLGGPRDEAGYREIIGSMLEEADRLTQLVDTLLTLSRGDAGQSKPVLAPTDLVSLAHEVVARLHVLAEEKRIEVTVEGSSVTHPIDALVLRQAVTNLVANAIEHAPVGSRIRVTVAGQGGEATIEVSDEGPGIAPENHARVFERFFRVDPSRSRRGTGLGLSIAKWAVEMHGGRIELASTVGIGSTFRIVLPTTTAP